MTGLTYIHLPSGVPFVATSYDDAKMELELTPTPFLVETKPQQRPIRFNFHNNKSMHTFKRDFVCFGISMSMAAKLNARINANEED